LFFPLLVVRRAADGSLRVLVLKSAEVCARQFCGTPGSPVGDFFRSFRVVFLTTEDTEITEEETAGRWYCFVSAFNDLASARCGRDAMAPSPPTPSPPAEARGGFGWCILWCISWTAFSPCDLSAAPPWSVA